MQAITSLLGSIFGNNSDATDTEIQQRLTVLEQATARQKMTNLILYGLVLILGIVALVSIVRKNKALILFSMNPDSNIKTHFYQGFCWKIYIK
jgi:hypothetical protein